MMIIDMASGLVSIKTGARPKLVSVTVVPPRHILLAMPFALFSVVMQLQ